MSERFFGCPTHGPISNHANHCWCGYKPKWWVPENPDEDIETIAPTDLEIQTTRQGIMNGPVHVKIIHIPTGEVGESTGKSELRARENAMEILRGKLRGHAARS